MVHALTAVAQLACLSGFGAAVYWLNQQAPRRVSQRVFKLSWLLPTVAAGVMFFWLMSTTVINAPGLLQTTNASLITTHDSIRSTCKNHLDHMRYDDAYETISVRTKTAELVGEHAKKLKDSAQHKSSIARLLQPILNSLLFHTGVSIVFFPALVRLLLLLWQIQRRAASTSTTAASAAADAKFNESVRREWGVFLPVMNVVTLLSLCVSPTFYFFIEPGRAQRCIYSSGHWYTFTCTCLTFAIVLTHLYRNRDYCKSCMRLLSWYFVWLVLYLATALMVLKTTQTWYHDALEARDGIRQSLGAFVTFMFILAAFQFLTRGKRDITDEVLKQVRATEEDGVEEEEDEEEVEETTTVTPTPEPAPKVTKKASSSSSSKKKKAGSRSSSHKKTAAPAAASSSSTDAAESDLSTEASFEFVEASSEDAAAATAATAVPDAPPAAPAMSSSSSVPDAPPAPPAAPNAPPPPSFSTGSTARSDIKITKSKKPATASAGADPDALFAQIKGGGAKLRKVDRSATGPAAVAAPPKTDLMSVLKAQMAAVRAGVDGEKEEADEEDW